MGEHSTVPMYFCDVPGRQMDFHFHLKIFQKYPLKKGTHHKEGRLNMTPNEAIPKKQTIRAVPIL